MNLLFVSEYFYPRAAGGEVWAWDLCRELARRGHSITVLTTMMPGTSERETKERVRILRPVRSGANLFSRKLAARSLAKEVELAISKRRPDLILTMAYAMNVPVSRIARRHKIPCITSVHSYFGKDWLHLSRIGPFLTLLERKTLKDDRSAVMHVPSRYLHDRIKHDLGRTTVVINNWLPERFPRPERFSQRTFVFVGSLVPVKNPLACIPVAKQHGARLVMIGNGPLRSRIIAAASKEGVALDLRADASRAATLAALGGADLVLIPSVTESFSLVALEAAAQGTPVAGTPVGILPEIGAVAWPPRQVPARRRDAAEVRKRFSKRALVDRFERFLLKKRAGGTL